MTMGRRKLKIDPNQVEQLAQLGATVKEIADFLQCSDATINNRFQGELDKGRANLKISLRRAQIRAALDDGSNVLLIWLGKQLLGQKDNHDLAVTTKTLTEEDKRVIAKLAGE